MSENALSAENQQGSSLIKKSNPSETTRRTPAPVYKKLELDDDIVHASWRHEGKTEQGTARGTWSWNNSI